MNNTDTSRSTGGRRLVLALASLGLLAGCGTETQAQPEASAPKVLWPDPAQSSSGAAADKVGILTDYQPAANAEELAATSDTVVSGEFIEIVGEGLGSDYGMAAAGKTDPQVQLWRFLVSGTSKGQATEELLVVRYNPSSVYSDQKAVSAGVRAVLFLTPEVRGARAVSGGNQGILRISDDGSLLTDDGMLLPGAESLSALGL